MLLLHTTLLLCSAPLFFSSANAGPFSSFMPKPTAKSKGLSDTPGKSYWSWIPAMKLPLPPLTLPWSSSAGAREAKITASMAQSTTESPPSSSDITTQHHIVSVEAITSPTHQFSPTQPEDTPTTNAHLGTMHPQRGKIPPTDEVLRGEPQTERPKPLQEHDPNYDLEFWPANKGRPTERFSSTALPLSSMQKIPTASTQLIQRSSTLSIKVQNAEAKSTTNDTPTGSPVSLSPVPRLMTTPANATQPVTMPQQPAIPTLVTNEGRIQSQSDLGVGPEGSVGTKTESPTTVTASYHALGPGDTNRATSTSPRLLLTTSMMEGEGLPGVPNLTHIPLTTISSLGGTEEENDDTTAEEPTALTAKERDSIKNIPPSMTTLGTTVVLATVSEDWMANMTQVSALPDCNMEHSGVCNFSGPWAPTYPTDYSNGDNISFTFSNQSQAPVLFPSLPMFVSLYSDWNRAMAAWGLAWEAHVYGLGTVFCLISLASALNLLCLPLCCPSGCGYFALVSLFLLGAGCSRAFALLYDAYGHQDRIASTEAMLLLYEAPFPCMTAAFGLVFLLLSMRSRMQLSYSAFQRPCCLVCLVLLHFATAFGPVTLLQVDQQGAPLCLFLSLISRGVFVALATFLSIAYFVFYCYVRADSKHIYHLNNTSPTPAERYNRCPFAESQDWDRAAAVVFLSAIFSLACAGLQLYAMLHAVGLTGGAEVFQPWPWWAFQLSCRVCEACVCLTLALVVSQPIYCSDHLPQPGSCWMELLAAKSPIIPGSYQWSLNQQEKLAICDPIGHGETECLPLYTLVDEHMGSLNGLDLLYHSNRALAYRDLDLPDALPNTSAPSVGSSCTSDSTADLRPPSPINLRRSIDEALFSEALFPMSLFSPMRPFTSSDHSLEGRDTGSSSAQTLRDSQPSDPGLYRTSSCVEMLPDTPLPAETSQDTSSLGFPASPSPSASSSFCSSPERWRGSSSSCSLYRSSLAGSSLVLCSSPEGHNPPPPPPPLLSGSSGCSHTTGPQASQQRQYRTQSSQETLEQQTEFDHSVQEEFISVCRQIDALSVCSETIDL
ncbi:proline-rich transmembrane protein 4 [Electrophorus electricus]|uniref:proline-rich transmembrane protein 4 n=1 Tax=Electrophorus electricus TaxID=8005 RepID=UPI0015D0A27C|nr:proline-rich transmembrane protein 4 [Electrophorus electricus]